MLKCKSYQRSWSEVNYYNFDLSDDKCAQFSERDYEVASYMALAFVNFARTGNPNINDSQVNIYFL